jgi:hypothetical protein
VHDQSPGRVASGAQQRGFGDQRPDFLGEHPVRPALLGHVGRGELAEVGAVPRAGHLVQPRVTVRVVVLPEALVVDAEVEREQPAGGLQRGVALLVGVVGVAVHLPRPAAQLLE